jgi:hypothetical protein
MLQRGGKMNAYVVNDTKKASIQPFIYQYVISENTRLISDEWCGYKGLGTSYFHLVVDHSKKNMLILKINLYIPIRLKGAGKFLKILSLEFITLYLRSIFKNM